ncbi:bifunctional metallophosphatase/5'-nucleotidase [Pseudogracilibacillus auburnensis]|uniref:bifunctional metallophosphatase/5'-nucleotidase n=1 Tax=Pseudogracilibacillus auburnensis TaxID=1494959 RepID=UPI001A9793EA|nr:bifunctional metallophosphatase/5'-nucleotidase [Pseudogracilibacillus auburnensis]
MKTTRQLTVLQMNDTHAYLNLHPEIFIETGGACYRHAGGYARIATLFKQIREQNPQGVVTLDNGDTFHGTYPAVHSKVEALVPIVNALNLDGMTAHWEFAYGPAQFEKIVSMLTYPMLANNCYRKKTTELVFPSHTIIERAGLKIGIIGISEHIVDKTMPPQFSKGIYFTLGNKELPSLIHTLRTIEKVDLVIVLSHVGFPQEVKLANEVNGIDILLSAHTHNRIAEPVIVNDTILIQSGCHGSFIGRLDVEVEQGRIIRHRHELIEVTEEIEPDLKVQAMINSAIKSDREMLETVIGQTETALNRYAQLESTMDNLLLEAIRDAAGASLAFSNGWRYGAPIPPGPITMNDLWNIIPTNPPISTVEITGEELLTMLEENLEHTFSFDPYKQMGGYVKRCLGMKMYVKLENPNGMRVQDLFIGNERVDKTKKYFASFVTIQGIPRKYGTNRRDLEIKAIDALKQYIVKKGTISIELHGTVQII